MEVASKFTFIEYYNLKKAKNPPVHVFAFFLSTALVDSFFFVVFFVVLFSWPARVKNKSRRWGPKGFEAT